MRHGLPTLEAEDSITLEIAPSVHEEYAIAKWFAFLSQTNCWVTWLRWQLRSPSLKAIGGGQCFQDVVVGAQPNPASPGEDGALSGL